MKLSGVALLAALLGLVAACKEHINVDISCITTAAPAVECTLTHTQGKLEVEVCWDFSATCGNGEVVTATRTCHKVKPGGTEQVTIGADQLTGIDKCAGSTPPTIKLENMTLNGKPTKLE